MTDYKEYLKNILLSNAQKRLFSALTREPTSHLYSREWQPRHYCTRSALRRLVSIGLIGNANGLWRVRIGFRLLLEQLEVIK